MKYKDFHTGQVVRYNIDNSLWVVSAEIHNIPGICSHYQLIDIKSPRCSSCILEHEKSLRGWRHAAEFTLVADCVKDWIYRSLMGNLGL